MTDQTPDPPLSLVVVPRSIVWNWLAEARRFASGLRLLDHTGAGRPKSARRFVGHDVVVTTYGVLRRDIDWLRRVPFHYIILDEAQAIKNPHTATAKAARLLTGEHRLALSGTPIENHLGELWSLFEFLNPGMLGAAQVFEKTTAGQTLSTEGRELLSRALRPFILRRTKEQVAPELPPKHEQTVYCDMHRTQRRLYGDLRAHYRRSLLPRVQEGGVSRSGVQVLEALLRLRQAACHPGLVDSEAHGQKPSAKLDVLMDQLTDVVRAGNKALVFSQFVRFLTFLRRRLEEAEIPYEYLDGRTRNRAARVRRFQNDPQVPLFLISLKAGGLGLNLTAAEYVFLLDPWWNPAAEAQAIDRTHRIGQTRQVFAYRLIARGTIEEKVLQLQQSKRDLADAIITRDNSLIRDLTPEDLELLLS